MTAAGCVHDQKASDSYVGCGSFLCEQFLDAMYQLLCQFPSKFEFNEVRQVSSSHLI